MSPTERSVAHKVLLVDDDDAVRDMMNMTLESKGFDVVAAASVTEALSHIATESFDVLITDLHMPNPGDGFYGGHRHAPLPTGRTNAAGQRLPRRAECYERHPSGSGRNHRETIRSRKIPELIREKMLSRRPAARLRKERVGVILQRCVPSIVEGWLVRAKQSNELSCLSLSDDERTGHLPKLVEDLALRLSQGPAAAKDGNIGDFVSAAAHGELRYLQGYTPAMLVHESRILQVTIFETLQDNLNHLDFSLLLPDVMTIADEVDSQLTQSMDSYMKLMRKSAA